MSESRIRSRSSVLDRARSQKSESHSSRSSDLERTSSRRSSRQRPSTISERQSSSRSQSRSSSRSAPVMKNDDEVYCCLVGFSIFLIVLAGICAFVYFKCAKSVHDPDEIIIVPSPFEVVNDTIIFKVANVNDDSFITNFLKVASNLIKKICRLC